MMTGFILYLPIYLSIADDYSIASITSVQWLQLLYMGLITSGLGLWHLVLVPAKDGSQQTGSFQ